MRKWSQAICGLLIICTICTAIFTFADFGGDETVESVALKKGSQGSDVKKVQEKLKSYGYYTGNIDGIYGSGTVRSEEHTSELQSPD